MIDRGLSQATRLFEVASYLATRNCLTTAAQIAKAFGVGLRTVYRDIADLRSIGAEIAGEAGSGFVLRQDQYIEWFLSKSLRNPRAGREQANKAERMLAKAMEMGND